MMTSDAQLELAVSRLTENEKECLRRRLLPQTAKEMAIDLGISVHAVEKRLKMARTRLGLTSSLEAARNLAKVEGYSKLVPHSPALVGHEPIEDETDAAEAREAEVTGRPRRHDLVIILGVLIMGFMFAALAALLSQASANSAAQSQAAHPPIDRIQTGDRAHAAAARPVMRPASPNEVREFLASSFSTMDRDHSGFIERQEAPATYGVGHAYPAGERPKENEVTWVTGRTAQAMWISRADTDGDGRTSRNEFIDWSFPIFARSGVPANWRRTP